MYEGLNNPITPTFDGVVCYAVIGKNAIAELDSEGNLQYGDGCNIDENKPCISVFSFQI